MVKERGNYNNACAVYARHYLNKRLTNWVTAERRLYNKFLAAKTKVIFTNGEKSFTNRVLIDTMLTVRFAHQPKDDLRQQYETCLREAGDVPRLEFMFFHVVQEAALLLHSGIRLHLQRTRLVLEEDREVADIRLRPLSQRDGTGRATDRRGEATGVAATAR